MVHRAYIEQVMMVLWKNQLLTEIKILGAKEEHIFFRYISVPKFLTQYVSYESLKGPWHDLTSLQEWVIRVKNRLNLAV